MGPHDFAESSDVCKRGFVVANNTTCAGFGRSAANVNADPAGFKKSGEVGLNQTARVLIVLRGQGNVQIHKWYITQP